MHYYALLCTTMHHYLLWSVAAAGHGPTMHYYAPLLCTTTMYYDYLLWPQAAAGHGPTTYYYALLLHYLLGPPLLQAMVLGTAGITATMCVRHLETAGEVTPSKGWVARSTSHVARSTSHVARGASHVACGK